MTPYLLLGIALFAIGAYGVFARRNLLIVLMSLELMLNGVNITLVTFSASRAGTADPHGMVFVLVVMAVAAAEVAVGLALLIALFRNRQTVDTNDLRTLNG